MDQPQLTVRRIGEFRVDPALDEISRHGIATKVEPRTMRVLLCLADHAGQVISVAQLLDLVWKDVIVAPDSVYQAIASLRRVLGDDPKQPKYIANVARRGYRLIAPVAPWTDAAASPPSSVSRSKAIGRPILIIVLICFALITGVVVAWRAQQVGKPRPAVTAPAGASAPPSAPAQEQLAVAVLPFDESTTESNDWELAQALAETLRQRLAVSPSFVVKARGSSIPFAEKQADHKAISRQLGARYLLTGSLVRKNTHLHVMAQLIDAELGAVLRSLEFDRTIGDVFNLQNEIAGLIANAVAAQLTGGERLREPRTHGTHLDAFLKLLDAQALLRRVTVVDAEQAALILEQVIKMEPGFALPYSELARARWLAQLLNQPKADSDALLPLAEKALSLDPDLGEAYFMRAVLEGEDHVKEMADFRKAVELAPNFAPGFEQYAIGLDDNFEQYQDALAVIERSILIDPLAAEYLVQKALYVLETAHSQAPATELYTRAQSLDPDFSRANQSLAMIKWRNGETAEAIKLWERALRADQEAYHMRRGGCALYLDIGDRQAAQSITVGVPADAAAITNTMLAAYDRDFLQAAESTFDRAANLDPAAQSYWISVDAVARKSGIAKSLARLRQLFPLEKVINGKAPNSDYDRALIVIGDLLRAQGDQAALKQLLPVLESLLDRSESRSGWAHSDLKLLSGDKDGALALLKIDLRRQHSAAWWILERDPLWADLKNDPRFQEIVQYSRDQAARQREILEIMRQRGEVPRRGSSNGAR
jgi:transcriptional activator of cad operon